MAADALAACGTRSSAMMLNIQHNWPMSSTSIFDYQLPAHLNIHKCIDMDIKCKWIFMFNKNILACKWFQWGQVMSYGTIHSGNGALLESKYNAFIQENAFQNIICQTVAILLQPLCVTNMMITSTFSAPCLVPNQSIFTGSYSAANSPPKPRHLNIKLFHFLRIWTLNLPITTFPGPRI